jgi:glycosyltransferase involved in cell wall biosynthesis
MRIAFVTPRYGPGVMGGAETAARQLAEHLVAAGEAEVEVFSTCALDHLSWENVLEPGTTTEAGVKVHRLSAHGGRDPAFFGLDGKLRLAPDACTRTESLEWVVRNGPVSPELVDAACHSGVDALACYPYLHYPSVKTTLSSPLPTILHPAAHDEPALYFPIYKNVYDSADAICYHTDAERRLVETVYAVADKPQIVLGLGIGESAGVGRKGAELLGIGERPYVVSVGRVDEHKGSVMLANFFLAYKERHPGPLALAFLGPVSAKMPVHEDIIITGVVSEEDKWDIVKTSKLSISPSGLESFSLVVLEGWVAGVPVMVNGTCGPTREHAERSGGGVWFDSYQSFDAALGRVLNDGAFAKALAVNGAKYVQTHYRWDVVTKRYADFVRAVIARGKSPSFLPLSVP